MNLPFIEFSSLAQQSLLCQGQYSCFSKPWAGLMPSLQDQLLGTSALMEAAIFNLEGALSFFSCNTVFVCSKEHLDLSCSLKVKSLDGSWLSLGHIFVLLFVDERLILFPQLRQLLLTFNSSSGDTLLFIYLIFRSNHRALGKVLGFSSYDFVASMFRPAYLKYRGICVWVVV